MAKTNCAAELA